MDVRFDSKILQLKDIYNNKSLQSLKSSNKNVYKKNNLKKLKKRQWKANKF